MLPDATFFEVDDPVAGDVLLSRSRPVAGTSPAHVLEGDTQYRAQARGCLSQITQFTSISRRLQNLPNTTKLGGTWFNGKLIYFFLTGFDEKYKTPRKLKLIKKPFQDIFNNKKRNKKKTYRNVHFIREHLF